MKASSWGFNCALGTEQAIGNAFDSYGDETLVAVLDIYIDDSDTMQRGNYVCLAGYVMAGPQWKQFAHLWYAKAIEHRLPGSYLHSSDFLSGQGIYADMGLLMEDRISVVRDFLSLIHKWVPLAIGVSVDATALAEISKKPGSPRIGAHMFLLARFLRTLELNAHRLHVASRLVSLICDHGESATRMLGTFRELKRSTKVVDDTVVAIAFADDRVYLPLQAADLFACLLAKEERRIRDGEQQIYGALGDLLDSTNAGQVTNYVGERADRKHLEEKGEDILAGMKKFYRR
jgi:hypothetical protein